MDGTAAPARRPVIVWDLVLTIALLVVMVAGGLALALFAFLLLAFGGDSCGASSTCDYDVMTNGAFAAIGGVVLAGVAALVGAIVLLVLRRLAFWVPLAGIVLMIAAFWIGATISGSGVRPMSG
ncbi:hypothetical protein [Agromyces arachidis]|uniref:hypothetical protein n=1 Tax=Agromyces arachidis TaxID=766966 RepID=UPI0040564839